MKQYLFKGFPIYDDQAFAILEELYRDNSTNILSALPWLVSELVVETGFREAMFFVYENGGKKYYIGDSRAKLSDKLGFYVSERLHRKITSLSDSSGYLEVPSPWGVSGNIRKALVVSCYEQGMTREEIRQNFGISNRLMTNIFNARH